MCHKKNWKFRESLDKYNKLLMKSNAAPLAFIPRAERPHVYSTHFEIIHQNKKCIR